MISAHVEGRSCVCVRRRVGAGSGRCPPLGGGRSAVRLGSALCGNLAKLPGVLSLKSHNPLDFSE